MEKKVTSNMANKVLKMYQEQIAKIINHERQVCVYTISGSESFLQARPEYDFEDTTKELYKLYLKVRKIKNAINNFNNITVLPNAGITISECLVYLPQLNSMLDKLENMSARLDKKRLGSGFGSNDVEYEYTNYDVKEVAKEAEKIKKEIIFIQTELDTVNNTVEFTIDVD